uniref:uncharacterized protein LOC122583264 n=1 Tax=Erigeron canadensis TaxID=72917 RepID=UPI001CB8B9FE|nr:uncharacterized protein LOC122583264 [Erigeron canadensis]
MIFLSNKQAKVAALETRFVNLTLAACNSVEDYCQQLKDLANQLVDVDQPVPEQHLVLQLVRVLVTPAAPALTPIQQQSTPSDPNSSNTSQQPQSQYRGRGRGCGQQYWGRRHGRGNRNFQSSWVFQNNSYPQSPIVDADSL